ncbi:hypothetical protein K491DRAFT_697694 [Lophiostoma macrostomum CBS 122681]|uniref:GAR domain-containing protein n=1 Tax=Lophiostoma macrostomum CBS 122681 TaxID=1314788 RepID=A0A6A6SSB7_9PLEO|nr:hypothetical protein K491DRAFT_697694 [Lophiostoma macrostomum CBS 122681]
MSALSSPPRFLPPISPRRAASPTMSPGGRRGRALGTSEDAHLRDLSPSTTLRAFTEQPCPFDTSRDEYKIFACIDGLTAIERGLGARVAKAALRLKSWCQEIEQWGWSGSFEPPSESFREARRRSLEMRVREHVQDPAALESVEPLVYWGSLLSDEVKAHELRLDEMSDELLTLDIEELKEHVLDIQGPNRSRPTSAGLDASRTYMPMDDLSFLITQTLLSALPHHVQLKDNLNTWTARVSILREAPKYLADLQTAQTAMSLGWKAIEPPADSSDKAFEQWKEAAETISPVLQGRVGDLGRRLDVMLDTLEGRADCLPENWIDTFEAVEADLGRWAHESRRRLIDLEVRRRAGQSHVVFRPGSSSDRPAVHSDDPETSRSDHGPQSSNVGAAGPSVDALDQTPSSTPSDAKLRSITAINKPDPTPLLPLAASTSSVAGTEQNVALKDDSGRLHFTEEGDDSDFEEGDTIVHNSFESSEESSEAKLPSTPKPVQMNTNPAGVFNSPVVVRAEEKAGETARETTEGNAGEEPVDARPHTPESRRSSIGSVSSIVSFSSSPPSFMEDSPLVRNATNRQARPPRPELNAAISKRRPTKNSKDASTVETPDSPPPWPPTKFSEQLSPNSTQDLERKISDILTTIPAHIRLTSQTGATVGKSKRPGVTNKNSKGLLRAARSMNGMKSPELTLSPAKHDSDLVNAASGRKSAVAMRNDNDIKVYHLTRPGTDKPMKLFIRRVGENGERVMVRVGGGWSDLGEFLRNYAEHHGRRAVSDGKFEILGLAANGADMSPRPESVMSKRDRRFSGGSTKSPTTTPQKAAVRTTLQSEAPPLMPDLTGTPGGNSGETSTPSTGSSRHSWSGNEVGLAGAKARKIDLTEEKMEWVEGMMKQARSVSNGNMTNTNRPIHAPVQQREGADSRSESRAKARKSDFGDLGKAGGTKRLYLRGGGVSEH